KSEEVKRGDPVLKLKRSAPLARVVMWAPIRRACYPKARWTRAGGLPTTNLAIFSRLFDGNADMVTAVFATWGASLDAEVRRCGRTKSDEDVLIAGPAAGWPAAWGAV